VVGIIPKRRKYRRWEEKWRREHWFPIEWGFNPCA